MNQEQIQWLKENLVLDIKTEDHYTYCGGDGNLYTSYKTVQLVLSRGVEDFKSFT